MNEGVAESVPLQYGLIIWNWFAVRPIAESDIICNVYQKVRKPFSHYLHTTCAVQNLFWKLGQQKPSAWTLLAYLDTMA